MTNEKVDIVIVGGGAAGIMLAAKMGTAGKKVAILEKGPAFELGDLISSQIWSRRLKQAGAPVSLMGRHPVGYVYNGGWGVGGGALHQFANWPRLHVEDFKMKSTYGRGLDWPISYDDLRPYYDRVQEEVGLSGDHRAEVWRPPGDAYPMPPVPTFKHAELVADGFKQIGIRVAPMPVAINTAEYKGRAACLYDGWCEAGCPIGALANPQVTYLPEALKTGADIRPYSTAARVLLDSTEQRAIGVEYYDKERQRQTQLADVVILAAWAGQNPRILFNSATDKHPKGLANSGDQLGRYVMAHPSANVWALFDEDIQNYMGLSAALLMSQDGYAKDGRSEAFGSYTWTMGMAQKPNDILGMANARLPVFGSALHDFMKRASRGLTKIQALAEELPSSENRVTLDEKKDEFGVPISRITHGFDDNALKLFDYARSEGVRALKATRASDVWAGPLPNAQHMAGGTIMGNEPATSVTDSYGRAHEFPNLFVAGPGLFPTEGAVHPTFTVHALTFRTAEHLIDKWGSIVQ